MNRIKIVFLILCLSVVTVYSQGEISGIRNYALGGSSVMRIPFSSALFLNPAEIARIHQHELQAGTLKFSTLSTLSGVHFEPSLGTFGIGIADDGYANQYSLGFGRNIGNHQTLGGAFNFIDAPNTSELTVSLGSSIHFMDTSSQNSGTHLGASIINFGSDLSAPYFSVNAGVGYWVMPDQLFLQGGLQYRNENTAFLFGGEYMITPAISAQAGTNNFEEFFVGGSYLYEKLRFDLGVGDGGLALSINFQFGDNANDIRDRYYQKGKKAYDDGQFAEAKENFEMALAYDEYFTPAQTFLNLSQSINETSIQLELRDAQKNEEQGNYIEARKNYINILRAYPNHPIASKRLFAIQKEMHDQAERSMTMGDSLRGIKDYVHARENYSKAIEMEPENQSYHSRQLAMEKMLNDSTSFYLALGKSRLDKNQLESARSAYQNVFAFDPKNPEAKTNIAAIDSKIKTNVDAVKDKNTTKSNFQIGKDAYSRQDYFEAMTTFLEVLKKEPKNKDAQKYLDSSRVKLVPQVEEYFKSGLQAYLEENYKKALEIWERALQIKPDHAATLEYKKRAEQKLEALEKLK